VRTDKTMYLCEMTASAAAVAVFFSVYVVGYLQAGALATLLLGWIPAVLLAWLTARLMRAAVQTVVDLDPAASLARVTVFDDEFERIVARAPRHRGRGDRDD